MDLFIRNLTERIRDSGAEALETALEFMFGVPFPRIGSDFFQSIYVQMWGLALIVAFIMTFIGIFRILYSKQSEMSTAGVATFVLRLWLIGFLLPPVTVGILLTVEYMNVGLFMMWQDIESPELTMIQYVERFFGSTINPLGGLMVWAGFALSSLLLVIMVFFSFGVLLLLAGAPLLYALVASGKSGIGIWRWWLAWLIVAVIAKPFVIIVLVNGLRFANFIAEQEVPAIMTDIASLITLALAVALPFIMHRYIKRWGPISSMVMPINSNARLNTPVGKGMVAVTTAGAAATTRSLYAQKGSTGPGKGRSSVSTGLSTAATMLPHPAAKTVAATGAFLSNSANRAKSKERSQA